MRETDAIVGRLLDGIAADPALAPAYDGRADRGPRRPRGCDLAQQPSAGADYTVPVIAWGRGVTPGADLYAPQPEPRPARHRLADVRRTQPVRNLDVADLALHLLGLPDLPNAGSRAPPG